jgi:hypothetical protein
MLRGGVEMKQTVSRLVRSLLPVLMIFVVLVLLVGCGPGLANTPPTNSNGTTTTKTGPNQPPVIDSIIPEWTQVERGKTTRVKCTAHDPDGDTISYKWNTSRGGITGEGPVITVTAPSSYCDMIISVSISDGSSMAAGEIVVPVVCCGYAKENPDWSE